MFSGTYCFGNLLCIMLEFFIELLSSLELTLLKFDLIFITVTILAFAIPRLVELYIRGLSIHLHILLLMIKWEYNTIARYLALVFFFPIMIGDFRWKWIMTNISPSQGWKKRCLILLKRRSGPKKIDLNLGVSKYMSYQSFRQEATHNGHHWNEFPTLLRGVCRPGLDGQRHLEAWGVSVLENQGSVQVRTERDTNPPRISTKLSCCTTSAISFFSFSRFVASLRKSEIALLSDSNLLASVLR